jgi:glycine/D-amino acid oxidase-like deaminating enzyme
MGVCCEQEKSVVIIGAGIAGLTTALSLAKKG